MKWEKLGLVYVPDGTSSWARTHATCPTPIVMGDVIRVYIQCRDASNVGRVGFVEVALDDPTRVVRVHDEPVLDIGVPGTFDENGVFQTCVLPVDGRLYLYYVGFELGTKIRYRMLSGAAISHDGGLTFARVKQTPILERSDQELFVRGGPWVTREGGRFRMWYVAGSRWAPLGDKMVPVYDVRHLESADGLTWPETGRVVLPLGEDDHAFGRPYVVPFAEGYRLFYSTRRRSAGGAYRLGYAESHDGLAWRRQDERIGLDVSPSGWDAEVIDYSAVVDTGAQTYMFYNGKDFGGTGFGVARLVSW